MYPWVNGMQVCHCEGNGVSKHLWGAWSPGDEWCAEEASEGPTEGQVVNGLCVLPSY